MTAASTTQEGEEMPYWERYYNEYPYGWYLSRVEERAVVEGRDLVGKAGHALDVGCEGGRWSRLLAERGWHLTCTDVSAAALAICHRRLPEATCLLVGEDDTSLPSPDASQHALLCVEVPMVLQSAWFLAEAARVLAPDGYLVGVHYNRRSLRGFLYNHVPGFRSKNDVAYFYFPEAYAAWRTLLRASGFELIREDGFGWIPFRKYSQSPLIGPAVWLERTLGLTRLARFSPMVVFIARKRAPGGRTSASSTGPRAKFTADRMRPAHLVRENARKQSG
jgi:SAM-dependent methyltransferase